SKNSGLAFHSFPPLKLAKSNCCLSIRIRVRLGIRNRARSPSAKAFSRFTSDLATRVPRVNHILPRRRKSAFQDSLVCIDYGYPLRAHPCNERSLLITQSGTYLSKTLA